MTQPAVAWHDPYNGDTERIAADAAAYHAKLCPPPAPGDARLSATREDKP